MKRSLGFLFSLLALAGLIVCLVMAYVGIVALPGRARRAFGPPAAALPLTQRFLLAYRLTLSQADLNTPVNPGGQAVQFEIAPGETPAAIARRLQQAGLIRNPTALVDYMVYTGLDTQLQSGRFTLDPGSAPVKLAQELQDATPGQANLVILAGWRMEEVAATLPTAGLGIDPEAFVEAARTPRRAQAAIIGLPYEADLEGYLFPGGYQIDRAATIDDLLNAMLDRFNRQVTADLRQAYQDQGYSLDEAVILASIVEREAMRDEEMPTIASVFMNRLDVGMRLESDPTVQYALGYPGAWWKSPLALSDLTVGSAYNTYQNAGLPPGPICNPGLPALQAVAFPAQTPYYFFRAACDGSGRHNFARTFEEHQANACP